MTLKFSYLRIPSGGAKAGMVIPPGLSRERRAELCFEFGRAISDLVQDGKYIGGLDMGTTVDDLSAIMAGAGAPEHTGGSETGIDSNYYTALTVLTAADALLEVRGDTLESQSVLIEGLGKVGGNLAKLLQGLGARISGVSTLSGAIYSEEGLDIETLLRLRDEFGDDCVKEYRGADHIPSADLFVQKADLLIPGGGPDSINASNIDSLQVRFIVPVANISASTRMERALHERGISFIPGFVSNSGGVFCWRLERLVPEAREEVIRRGLKRKIARTVREAKLSGQPIAEVARRIALENLGQMKESEEGGLWVRLSDTLRKISLPRIGYVIGSNLIDAEWSRRSTVLTRSYFDARYFS
jgi:glutamate dehydrogenase/leucine dehydrogenase